MTAPDFHDPDLYLDGPPHELWRKLRVECPVYWNPVEERGFWAILKHADVLRVTKDPDTFGSNRGVAHKSVADTMAPPEVLLYPPGPRNLLLLDPPDHGPFRRVVSRGFTPATVSALEPKALEIVDEILADLRGREECDFAIEVAARLASSMLCELLGAPRTDWKFIWDITQGMNNAGDPEFAPRDSSAQVSLEALQKTIGYFADHLRDRKDAGGQTLFSRLLDAGDKQVISDADFVSLCMTLTAAGHEPVRNAISAGVMALHAHPEQHARLVADRSLLDSAVEEILRWSSPLMTFGRYVRKDTELSGQQIRAGQRVVLFFASANRDEEVFEAPFVFDVARSPNPHLAFGAGPHTCLGASLARMQLKAVFGKLLDAGIHVVPTGPPQWLRSNFVAGIKHLPARLTPS